MIKFNITEDRVLQITNDISEDMDPRATRAELKECIRWWALKHFSAVQQACAAEQRLAIEKATKVLKRINKHANKKTK